MVRCVLGDGPGVSAGEIGLEASDARTLELLLEHALQLDEGAPIERGRVVLDERQRHAVRIDLFVEPNAVLRSRLHLHKVAQPRAPDLRALAGDGA